ncbi:MAG TPA: CARDB domain-containing protein [Phycisphaerae bacterium]|nr:CARDB domain-containing protein [Phycisphaerae bacterium]
MTAKIVLGAALAAACARAELPPPPPFSPAGVPAVSTAEPAANPSSTADLDVTYIERTPRYDYDAAKNNPAPGDSVTFRGHIRNTGDSPAASVDYEWRLDDVPVASGTLTNLAVNEERVVTWGWVWQDGNHWIKLQVDPNNVIGESSEVNNEVVDRTDGIIVGFWVEQSVYDYFHQYQKDLGVGSNSWDDWAQRQMRFWNQFSQNAIYPTTPNGVLDRVRIDKIVVVPDGALPLAGGYPTNHPDLRDKTVDLMWGFPATLLNGSMYSNHTSASISNPFYYEGSLLHELGHARYLIDTYGFDVHNTSSHHSVQIYEGSVYVAGSSYMPFLAWGEVLYYNKYGKMMSGGYDQGWSEYDAGALNRIAGQRACCGNYNAPYNIGAFLNDLPANNHLRITDEAGQPRRGANVRIYQAVSGPGWYGKTIDNTPDLEFTTDNAGYVLLPRNPFTAGSIQHNYGIANGIMVVRIAHLDQIWYRFQEVTDFNIQYWRGNTQDAYYTIALPGPNETPVSADFDGDGDVDQEDFGHFQICLTGSGGAIAPGCEDAILDGDTDVDAADLSIFTSCISGADVPPADPTCLDLGSL